MKRSVTQMTVLAALLLAGCGKSRDEGTKPATVPRVQDAARKKAPAEPEESNGVPALHSVKSAGRGTEQSSTNAQTPTTKPKAELSGVNPRGDEVEWEDGTVWRNVTVRALKMQKEDGKEAPVIEIADVPPGRSRGSFSNWVRVRLRGEPVPSAIPKEVISVTDISGMFSPGSSLSGPPPLRTEYADTYISEVPFDWDRRTIKPPFSVVVSDKEGNRALARFDVTITHLLRRDGQVIGLIRKTKTNTATPENYFTGFKIIIFARDAKK